MVVNLHRLQRIAVRRLAGVFALALLFNLGSPLFVWCLDSAAPHLAALAHHHHHAPQAADANHEEHRTVDGACDLGACPGAAHAHVDLAEPGGVAQSWQDLGRALASAQIVAGAALLVAAEEIFRSASLRPPDSRSRPHPATAGQAFAGAQARLLI